MSATLASDQWGGAKNLIDEYAERAEKFVSSIDWQAVLAHCAALEGCDNATLSERWTLGAMNLVRHIQFEDGNGWVIRFLFPHLDGHFEVSDRQAMIQNVVSGMRYLS